MHAPSSTDLERIRELADSGKGLTAYEIAKDFSPLAKWKGVEAKKTAARLATALGRYRLSHIFDWQAWKLAPADDSLYFQALFSRSRFKPLPLLALELETELKTRGSDPHVRADMLSYLGSLHARLRDFKNAHELSTEALSLRPDFSWLHVERASILQMEDRYDEALTAADRAVELQPDYRPALLTRHTLLIQLGRDEEALSFIQQAQTINDSPTLAMAEFAMHSENDRIDESLACLDEFVRRSPLLSKKGHEQIAARRADLLYLAGDHEQFLKEADQSSEDSIQKKLATHYRSQSPDQRRRKKLNVPFIRQHNMTCAPATLASLSAYFQQEHDHLEIANAICYEGTPWHKERAWCESKGFVVREFRVTEEIAHALIDRELPFTLTTVAVTSAHLQACIGYDQGLGTLILRDPTHRHYGEVILKSLIDDHPVSGPRGMLFIPSEKEELVKDLRFPDEHAYTLYYQISNALDQHDLGTARNCISELQKSHSDSLIYEKAVQSYAHYTENNTLRLRSLDRTAEKAPKSQLIALQRFSALESVGRYAEARELLENTLTQEWPDPVFQSELGLLLSLDEREASLAHHHLWRSMLKSPEDARPIYSFASTLQKSGAVADALTLKRWCACLAPAVEGYALAFYQASRLVKRQAEAMTFLEERCQQIGPRQSEPHISYLKALEQHAPEKAIELARRLPRQFPADGQVLLESCLTLAYNGESDDALVQLESSTHAVKESEHLQIAARVYTACGRRGKATRAWRQLASSHPHRLDAHEAIADWTREVHGEEEAISYIEKVAAKHPHSLPLQRLLASSFEFYGPERSIPVLQKIVSQDPDDMWSRRELALEYQRSRQPEKAVTEATEAVQRDPHDPTSHAILGRIFQQQGNRKEATVAFKRALTLSIDTELVISNFVWLGETYAERKEALNFVRNELLEQVSNGNAVSEYTAEAIGLLDPEDLHADLELFLKERPDLFQTWTSLIEWLTNNQRSDETLKTATEFTERHPFLPRAWLDLARAARKKSRRDIAERAFERCIELSPGWDEALREFSDFMEEDGQFDRSLALLDQAIQRNPLLAGAYGYKADLEQKLNRPDTAFETLSTGLTRTPFYEWGWNSLHRLATQLDRGKDFDALLEKVGKTRSHLSGWWRQRAEITATAGNLDEALEHIDHAISLDSESSNLLDLRSVLLSDLGRYDEALEQTQVIIRGERPLNLRGREAWVHMQMGQGADAWDMMSALTKEHPDYSWAQQTLADWAYKAGDSKALRSAASSLTKLSPANAYSWSLLAEAEQAEENNEAALAAITEAFQREPTNSYYGRFKFDLELKQNLLDRSGTTIRLLEHHHPKDPWVATDRFRYLLKTKADAQTVEQQFSRFFAALSDPENPQPFFYLRQVFEQNNQLQIYDQHFLARLKAGKLTTSAEAAAQGALIAEARRPDKRLKEALSSPLSDSLKATLLGSHLCTRWRINDASKTKALALFKKHKSLLWNSSKGYQYALEFCADHRLDDESLVFAKRWTEYETGLDQSGYLLVSASFDSFDLAESFAVREAAIQRFPQWEGNEITRLCAGFYLASDGRPDEARNVLSGFNARYVEGLAYYQAIYHLTRAVLGGHSQDAAEVQSGLNAAGDVLNKYSGDKALKRYVRRATASLEATMPQLKTVPRFRKKHGTEGLLSNTNPEVIGYAIGGLLFIGYIVLKVILKD